MSTKSPEFGSVWTRRRECQRWLTPCHRWLTPWCSGGHLHTACPEKLVPLMIINATSGSALPVYGTGLNVRDCPSPRRFFSSNSAMVCNASRAFSGSMSPSCPLRSLRACSAAPRLFRSLSSARLSFSRSSSLCLLSNGSSPSSLSSGPF